jgi:hypothetical protein
MEQEVWLEEIQLLLVPNDAVEDSYHTGTSNSEYSNVARFNYINKERHALTRMFQILTPMLHLGEIFLLPPRGRTPKSTVAVT